ncbi:hypothetical protein [Desulfosporosinus sp. SB140]|uniref:hypothetical protein n=1 Tax=Desulfosporosinus paludis TaxID=3115649 RepID=UPI00388FD0AD
MLRKLLEQTLGPISNSEFHQILDLATTDIKTNRVAFGKRTSFKEVVEIAIGCHIALQRGKVA